MRRLHARTEWSGQKTGTRETEKEWGESVPISRTGGRERSRGDQRGVARRDAPEQKRATLTDDFGSILLAELKHELVHLLEVLGVSEEPLLEQRNLVGHSSDRVDSVRAKPGRRSALVRLQQSPSAHIAPPRPNGLAEQTKTHLSAPHPSQKLLSSRSPSDWDLSSYETM